MISVNYFSQCLLPCDYDTKIALHLYDAVHQGSTNMLMHSADINIIIIFVGLLLISIHLSSFWHWKAF